MRYYSDLLEKVFDTKKELEEAEEKYQEELEKEMAEKKEPINDRWYVAMGYIYEATIDDIDYSHPFKYEWEAAFYAKKSEGNDRDTSALYFRCNDRWWKRELVSAEGKLEEFNYASFAQKTGYATNYLSEYWQHMY